MSPPTIVNQIESHKYKYEQKHSPTTPTSMGMDSNNSRLTSAAAHNELQSVGSPITKLESIKIQSEEIMNHQHHYSPHHHNHHNSHLHHSQDMIPRQTVLMWGSGQNNHNLHSHHHHSSSNSSCNSRSPPSHPNTPNVIVNNDPLKNLSDMSTGATTPTNNNQTIIVSANHHHHHQHHEMLHHEQPTSAWQSVADIIKPEPPSASMVTNNISPRPSNSPEIHSAPQHQGGRVVMVL